MKIESHFGTDDYQHAYCLIVDGVKVIEIYEGEPEDMTLSRGLSSVRNVLGVIEKLAKAPAEDDVTVERFTHDSWDDMP